MPNRTSSQPQWSRGSWRDRMFSLRKGPSRFWPVGLPSFSLRGLFPFMDFSNIPFPGLSLPAFPEFSPYLFGLIRADAARLIRLLLCEPDQHLASLIAATTADVLAAAEESEAMRQLRRMKSDAALLIALCDIGGVWPVMRVTEAMS